MGKSSKSFFIGKAFFAFFFAVHSIFLVKVYIFLAKDCINLAKDCMFLDMEYKKEKPLSQSGKAPAQSLLGREEKAAEKILRRIFSDIAELVMIFC